MKKQIMLSVILIMIILGCAGRKVHKSKEITKTVSAVKVDSLVKDKSQKTTNTETISKVSTDLKEISFGWKYIAPTVPSMMGSPIWLRVGKDSVDISKLPAGSSLEANSKDSEKRTDSIGIIKKLEQDKKDLETRLKKAMNKKAEQIKITKEVEKEGLAWILGVSGLLLGLSLPSIYKAVKKAIFKPLKPI